MKSTLRSIFGNKVSGVRVVPLSIKIIVLFTIFLLVSNFATNFINLMLNRGELIGLMNQLLVKDLKELHTFCNNQADIYKFNQDLDGALNNIIQSASKELKGEKSTAFGMKTDGTILFQASKQTVIEKFSDQAALEKIQAAREKNEEGSILFYNKGSQYFGVFKYNEPWDVMIVRAEELNEFYSDSWRIFWNIVFIIIGITVICVVTGVFIIRYILRFVNLITSSLMKMQEEQNIDLIDLTKAPNDDITYLGMSFNALSSTIKNLMTIFVKFVAEDVAERAYREKEVRLEGTPKELTILFSDIKGFTYMTETLENDIISLLNMHYERAIYHIRDHGGIIGSIIGDALLAVYGTLHEYRGNKSYDAILSAYEIQEVAASLRKEMNERREALLKKHGALTEGEERVYRAVLIEVGVGIDGGEVFYGNIGSSRRMTNTVIGDNVNSSSRLEGLTRIYKVPVICSEFVKLEVEKDHPDEIEFIKLDKVQVKGKTEGKIVYWPVKKDMIDGEFRENIDNFSQGLELYDKGSWPEAYKYFKACALPMAEVFKFRTRGKDAPKGWNGIWTMTTK